MKQPQPASMCSEKEISEFQRMVVMGISPRDAMGSEEAEEEEDPIDCPLSIPEPEKPKEMSEVEAALRACPPQPITWLPNEVKKDKKEEAAAKKLAKEEAAAAKKAAAEELAAAKKAAKARKAEAEEAVKEATKARKAEAEQAVKEAAAKKEEARQAEAKAKRAKKESRLKAELFTKDGAKDIPKAIDNDAAEAPPDPKGETSNRQPVLLSTCLHSQFLTGLRCTDMFRTLDVAVGPASLSPYIYIYTCM